MENENSDWQSRAIDYLHNSLARIPQELNELDWKVKVPENDKIGKHLSAFGNQMGGGFFAFGIEDNGKPVNQDKKTADKILEKIANLARNIVQPEVTIQHFSFNHKGCDILIIYVNESAVKPVHIKGQSIEVTYVRSGGQTRRASRVELTTLLLNSKQLRFEELNASTLLSKDAVFELLDYQKVRELLHLPQKRSDTEIVNWLILEKMIKKGQGDAFYITNLGAILCAKNLRKFDDLKIKGVRLIKYKGVNKTAGQGEIFGRMGYALGFQKLIEFVLQELPHSEILKESLRVETCVYPSEALRELIANALIHQDLTIRGTSPMIELFDDRIEITNPGKLLPSKAIDRLIGTNPEARNEQLSQIMRRCGMCELRGSGYLKIVKDIELYGLPPLKWEEGNNYFKVTIFSPKKFATMSSKERIEAAYQHANLQYFSHNVLTNTSLRKRFQVNEKSRRMVTKVIGDAIKKQRIKLKDPENKSIKYAEYIPYWA